MDSFLASRPIFVVGMGRSGTTLMRSLISAHPLLQVAPETHFVSYWMWRYRSLDLCDEAQREAFWSAFTAHEQFANLGVDGDEVWDRVEGPPSFKALFRALLTAHSARHGKPGWGEKTPNHFRYIDQLLEWYPEARIVFLIRDPRAVVASWHQLDRPWTKRSIGEIAAAWRDSIYEADRWTGDRRVQTVRYEDLLRDAEGELRSLFGFLGVDFPAEALAAREAQSRGLRPLPDGALRLEPSDRWRTLLTAAETHAVERGIKAEMVRCGYSPISKMPPTAAAGSTARRALYRLRRTRRTARRRRAAARSTRPRPEAG